MVFKEECGIYRGSVVFIEGVLYLKRVCGI